MLRRQMPVVKLFVAALAGVMSILALRTLGYLAERSCMSREPWEMLGAAVVYVGVSLLMPSWSFRGTAWLAVSVGWAWAMLSAALCFVWSFLLTPGDASAPSPLDGERIVAGVLLSVGFTLAAIPIIVPIGVAGALVMWATERQAGRQDALADDAARRG